MALRGETEATPTSLSLSLTVGTETSAAALAPAHVTQLGNPPYVFILGSVLCIPGAFDTHYVVTSSHVGTLKLVPSLSPFFVTEFMRKDALESYHSRSLEEQKAISEFQT